MNEIGNLETQLAGIAGFMPELVLCGAIVSMLLVRMFKAFDRTHLGLVALAFVGVALALACVQWGNSQDHRRGAMVYAGDFPMFSGLLAYDTFMIFVRVFLLAFLALVIWLSLLTGIPDREDSADFYSLLLGATLGMCLMASANHLLMFFIGVEMASLPSYALAGFLKGRRQSSEAALKYVVYGGGASGVMLYGISLIAGKFGTGYLPDLANGFAATLYGAATTGAALDPILVLGTLFLLIGLAFKLAAVPFHFWCPDVFEGASAEVAAFLSVASKGAALALLARFLFNLAALPLQSPHPMVWLKTAEFLAPGIGLVAAVTATFGNLAAYTQTNLKRLLAYSTIAHAGIMMMGLVTFTAEGASAVLFYLVAYAFMNLGAFAVVAFVRNLTGTEELEGYRGLIHRAPALTVALGIFLLSLLGIPPLAGFAAKFQIFSVLYDAGRANLSTGSTTLAYTMFVLLVVGGLNTVLGAFYYMKVLKVAIIDKPAETAAGAAVELPVTPGTAIYASILAGLVVVGGILWNPLVMETDKAVSSFHKPINLQSAAESPRRR